REAERSRAQTAQLVEHFKRENAILHNSLHFLPVLASELDHAAAASLPTDLHVTITELIRDELLLQSWRDPALLERIDHALGTLASANGGARPLAWDGLATVVTH